MVRPVLSRTQQNQLFELTQKAELAPGGFSWSAGESNGEPSAILKHVTTGSFIEISEFNDGQWWISLFPAPQGVPRYDSYPDWDAVCRLARSWLAQVKADDEAPDLWAELAKSRLVSDAAGEVQSTSSFTEADLLKLATALDEIQEFVISSQSLDGASAKQIRSRFAYLLGAAKRGVSKIDWLNIFTGQVVSMVFSGLLDSRAYTSVMSHAGAILSALFQFAHKLLDR